MLIYTAVLEDNTFTNITWAGLSKINIGEIRIMEIEFLGSMRYSLYASEVEWKAWHLKLWKFWHYFNIASKAPTRRTPKFFNLQAPVLNLGPDLSSGPTETGQVYHKRLLPSMQVQPYFMNFSRKRSLDGASTDGPSKILCLG